MAGGKFGAGKVAWFSSSVDKKLVNQWIQNLGGAIVTNAKDSSIRFFFSDDNGHKDTRTLRSRLPLLRVFTSQLIVDAVSSESGSVQDVQKYTLPSPAFRPAEGGKAQRTHTAMHMTRVCAPLREDSIVGVKSHTHTLNFGIA